MFTSTLQAEVAQVERELKYYIGLAKEQQEIIEQLTGTGQPKGYVYMHPADVAELVSTAPMTDIWIYRNASRNFEAVLPGRNIKQSPHIPALTKNIK